jgi:transglutaminase-like putative cysteine protease
VSVESADPLITSGMRVRDDGSLHVAGISSQGLTYAVRSQVPELDVAQLASRRGELSPIFAEAAAEGLYEGEPVPDVDAPRPSVIDHYTDRPEASEQLEELTRDITAPAVTPFEHAVLLEEFFRDGDRFAYDTAVTSGQGALDMTAWLTDPESLNYRTGYCEQFATAMAVMGRIAGLPTRVAVGFTPGETTVRDDGTIGVEVLQRNAHAWVEVWFDEAGWVRFDPTPRSDGVNQPTTAQLGFEADTITPTRPETDAAAPPIVAPGFGDVPGELPVEDPDDLVPLTSGGTVPAWVWVALALMGGLALLPGLKWLRRRRRLARIAAGDIEAAWQEIVDRLTDLGAGPRPSQTPLEFAGSRHTAMVDLATAYSAAVYGGKDAAGAEHTFASAESWLRSTYDGPTRARAAFNPRSFSP